jgi:hypothetical protein
MRDCFKFTLSFGLQNGGGVGDSFIHSTGQRLILDISFYCIVLVILLNVIFGIIIDTFSSLRVEKLERNKDTLETCFICGINKQVFDRSSDEPEGFKTHIKVDHNMWNYLYFIFMLWEQDKDDDDGLEQYVRRAIDATEITWFPLRKAMRLDQVVGPAELLRNDLKDSVKVTESVLVGRFDEFQTDVNSMFDQLLLSLKNEHPAAQEARSSVNTPKTPGSRLDEDASVEEGSVVSENTYIKDLSPGKHVSFAIASIDGLQMQESDLATVMCRIVTPAGVNDFKNCGLESNGTVRFDLAKKIPIFDNVQPADRRMFQVQILYGTGVMKFISVIEMSALELISGTEMDFVLDKSFSRPQQQDMCTLHISLKTEVAKTFGRENSIKDKPTTPGEASY